MSKNCKCKKCVTYCCEEVVYNDPCVLLTEPCNPCPPKQITYCVPNPPCQPPCPPYPCPTPCPPSAVNPQYVIYTSILGGNGGDITLTNTQVNFYNMFAFNNKSANALTVTLPLISTLNNGGKKYINITSHTTLTLKAANNGTNEDSLSGLTTFTLDANKSVALYSLPGISSGKNGNVWSLIG